MLSPQDDFIGHQLPTTFNHVATSDDRWTERYWYSGMPIATGDVLLDMGLGFYPNKNVMDAFAGLTVDNVQHTYRASRRLGRTPLDTSVGAVRFEIVEGLKRHRVTLAENPSGLTFDLEFLASFPGTQEGQSFRRRHGRVEEDLTRMAQFGRWQGWISLGERRWEIDPEAWWAQRDHSWGVRSVHQTDIDSHLPVQRHSNFFWFWLTYQFEDFGLALFLKERSPDKQMYFSGIEIGRDGKERHVERVEHDMEWRDDPLGQTWKGGKLRLHYEDGATRELTVEGLPGRFYLKAGGYGGFEGWNHGDDKGDLFQTAYRWDLTDPDTRSRARTLGDHATRVTTDDGQVGFGMSEYGVAAGYPKYQAVQCHPAL
ncbi:hypothetical protein [Amorphus sp. MBR-141]